MKFMQILYNIQSFHLHIAYIRIGLMYLSSTVKLNHFTCCMLFMFGKETITFHTINFTFDFYHL